MCIYILLYLCCIYIPNIETAAQGKKGGGAGERGFEVSKCGDTRVGLVGFPSVGKSTLLTKMTGTFSLAAGYEFTTLTAIPGTMHYRGAKIQILDLPGIIEGAKDGKGRGRQVLAAALTCNVILIVLLKKNYMVSVFASINNHQISYSSMYSCM